MSDYTVDLLLFHSHFRGNIKKGCPLRFSIKFQLTLTDGGSTIVWAFGLINK